MANPFFNRNMNQGSNPFGGPPQNQNMFQKFMEFRNSFQGDPKQKVQELLNSGQMSQQQFNYLSNLAQQFQSMFRK